MARNEEKAQALLNRFLTSKQEARRGPSKTRPHVATECKDLNEADKWRQQVLREIGKKVMEIQNAGLGEYRIRDLNDEINKLIREKGHWEKQIVELGGPNYMLSAPKITDVQGNEINDTNSIGYKYFGAAKNLPGVKDLFEKEPPKKIRRTRHDMFKKIDGDYYGFRDEDDGLLLDLEDLAQKNMRAMAIKEWQMSQDKKQDAIIGIKTIVEPKLYSQNEAIEASEFIAYVPLPNDREIEKRIIAKKKADLISKYASEDLIKDQNEAKNLLNKN